MCNDNYFPTPNFACGGFPKSTSYSVDYFINFFGSVPENRWMVGNWHNEDKTKFCAMGLLGADAGKGHTKETNDLANHLGCNPAQINDGKNKHYQQSHPKYRILAALTDVKNYGAAKHDVEQELKGTPLGIIESVAYKKNYFNEMYSFNLDYGKIVFEELPKIEVKEVIKEVIVEKIVEKIVYVTVDQEVRELQEETLKCN